MSQAHAYEAKLGASLPGSGFLPVAPSQPVPLGIPPPQSTPTGWVCSFSQCPGSHNPPPPTKGQSSALLYLFCLQAHVHFGAELYKVLSLNFVAGEVGWSVLTSHLNGPQISIRKKSSRSHVFYTHVLLCTRERVILAVRGWIIMAVIMANSGSSHSLHISNPLSMRPLPSAVRFY